MNTHETRGYLLGKTDEGDFILPKKLKEKIISSTSDTFMVIWKPKSKSLKFLNVESEKITKLIVFFDHITQTLFDTKLNPVVSSYNDIMIHKSGVQFPESYEEKAYLEYYLSSEDTDRIEELRETIDKIEGINTVQRVVLERYSGD